VNTKNVNSIGINEGGNSLVWNVTETNHSYLRDCDYQNVNSIGINEGGDSLFGMLTTVI
jgi:hypothetical protein